MRNPLVSIIIPIYNRDKYIGFLLEAIEAQTYSNLEILCIDDGSTDSSVEIVESFASKDSRIKIFKKKNGGAVSASCLGIEEATGEYVCFIDSDDMIGEDYINNFIKELDDEYDFIATGYFNDNGEEKIAYYLKENHVYTSNQLEKYSNFFLVEEGQTDISNRFFISRWNKMYSLTCLKKILVTYKSCIGVTLGEDSIFNYCVIKNSKLGKTVAQPNSYYYNTNNENSVMKDTRILSYINKCDFVYSKFEDILSKDGFDDRQALYVVYYHIMSLFNRLYQSDKVMFDKLYIELKDNVIYQKSLRQVITDCKRKKFYIHLQMQNLISNPRIYRLIGNIFKKYVTIQPSIKK